MHLLLDANISWRLVDKLVPFYDEVEHVDSIGLPALAKDVEIWEYARRNGAVIVTNDDDFSLLSLARGFPPNVVVFRTGNQSNQFVLEMMVKHHNDIQDLCSSSVYGLLEIA